jgi:perosamine synthetase
MMKISIAQPLIGEAEKEAVLNVLSSGMLAQGPIVARFEEHFAEYCGVNYAIATSSGTTALHVALLAHNIGPGDEVITTAFSFIATANTILYVGAKPIFVDIDPETYNMRPEQIEAAITPRTRAILPVHLFGLPCNMEAIMDIAARHNLVVIEDACQAHGAAIQGRRVGSFGTGCFSFYPTKNMTCGEGGMITTNDATVAELACVIRNHGMKRRYHHDLLGYNFRMTDIHAAIGLVQLDRLEEFNEQRIRNAQYLTAQLVSVKTPCIPPGYRHVFHQYTIQVNKDRWVLQLAERDISTGVYYPIPIHWQSHFKKMGYEIAQLPITEQMSRQVLSLPVHPGLSQDELTRIVKAVNELQDLSHRGANS